jgi:hypothetical protein
VDYHNRTVLAQSMDKSHPQIGKLVHSFLKDAPWLRRRVETVSFLDVDTIERRTTLDVDIAQLKMASAKCPMDRAYPLVPIAVLRKDLLVDFDLRDRFGGALAVVPRSVDSYFAWSALCVAADGVLGAPLHRRSIAVATRLRELAYDFPEENDTLYSEFLASWEKPNSWAAEDHETWRTLLENEGFSRLLRDLTFNFILLTQVATDSHLQIVKFSYQEYVPYTELFVTERLGLKATELSVVAPSVGWGCSYHLRVEAPTDIALTEVGLFRVQRAPVRIPGPAESYEARLGAESVQVYTATGIERGEHVVAVSMRVQILGFLRAMWLTSVAMAGILIAGRVFISRLETATQQRSDAAIALLLVAPSLVAAYLVRPGEHVIASRLLRPIRYALAVAACLNYVGAAALVLGWRGGGLRLVWLLIAVGSGLVAAGISLVIYLTKRDLDSATDHEGNTEQRRILVVDYT